MDSRRIVALGGGGFSEEGDSLALDRFILTLARRERPRVCFVPTASGDSETYLTRFYRAFSTLECQPTDLALFERTVVDLAAFLFAQDVVYVGGGNTASLLAVWRVHGLDRLLRRAWEEGIVLCGISAGMNCWFESSVTDSFAMTALAPLHDGLGLIPASACPHYDGEPQRRPTFERLVGSGELAGGWAADESAGLVFHGASLHEVVASRPDARGYRVERAADGGVSERPIAARLLES